MRKGLWQLCAVMAACFAVPAVAQPASEPLHLAALDQVEPGMWEINGSDTAPKSFCLFDRERLVQIAHEGPACTRFVIANDPRTATVSYSCRSGGSGQTTIRADRAGVVKIHTQGILRNEPFDYSVEARRVGACSVAANAGGGR
jgi:hypothetical protein